MQIADSYVTEMHPCSDLEASRVEALVWQEDEQPSAGHALVEEVLHGVKGRDRFQKSWDLQS